MRILIKRCLLTFSIAFVAYLLLPQSVRADGGEEYYKELRKLKKFDQATVNQLKKNTIEAELIKKANAESRANAKHNAEVDAKTSKKDPVIPKDLRELYPPPATGPNGEKAGPPRYGTNVPNKASSKPANKDDSKTDSKPVSKKESPKKESTTTPTGPIKVDHETPDELSFPGTNE